MTTTATPDFREELLAVFAQEGGELLERIERELIAIEHASKERRRKGLMSIRRHLHTLKGAAGALGISPVVHVCHELEEGLGTGDDEPELTPQLFDVFHRALAHMSAHVTGEKAEPLEAVLSALGDTFADPGGVVKAPQGGGEEEQKPVQSEAPSPAAEAPSQDENSGPSPSRSAVVRVESARLDDLQAVAGELVVLNLQQDESQRRVERLRDHLAGILSEWRTLSGEMHELAGELTSNRWQRLQRRSAEVTRGLKSAYRESYEFTRWSVGHAGQMGLVSNALEDGLRNIRMQPLGPFLDSFARVVREAARKEGKQVRFETRGREIQVDRSVLERLREPMIHLVRNSVAHGIEVAQRRRQLGKPPVGIIRLEAQLMGEKVCLAVRDDGGGIDAEAVEHRAVEAGILRSGEGTGQRRLLDLLVHPGFSTRVEVDEVAGRGIGLDVVEAAVAELGGKLELENQPGKGAAFHLIVPTSITTSQGLIVEVGDYRLGIQIDAVERIIRIDRDELHVIEGKQVYYHDGDPVAVANLGRLIGASGEQPQGGPRRRPALILRSGRQRLAVMVDDIPGEMPMVVKPLGPQFERVRHLTGGAVQANGTILPVLEHRELFRMATGQSRVSLRSGASRRVAPPTDGDVGQAMARPAKKSGPATILVVDDSVTTRTLERNILEAAGYQVITATDGAEAYEVLETHDEIDLVVTDLEMPRVSGLELCRQVRQSKKPELPLIIVTSRGDEEDVRRGLEAGADAYIVKGKFDQDHFMTTIKRFVD